jgi:hypothetical protein
MRNLLWELRSGNLHVTRFPDDRQVRPRGTAICSDLPLNPGLISNDGAKLWPVRVLYRSWRVVCRTVTVARNEPTLINPQPQGGRNRMRLKQF